MPESRMSFSAWILAGFLTGIAFSLTDFLFRFFSVGSTPSGWTWGNHIPSTIVLYASLAALVGGALWVLSRTEVAARFVAAPLGLDRFPHAIASLIVPPLVAAFVALWIWTSSFSAPSGWVDWTALFLASLGTILLIVFAPLARQRFERLSLPLRLLLATILFAIGCVTAWLDMTILVALYPFLHAVAEVFTAAFWLISFRMLLLERARYRRAGPLRILAIPSLLLLLSMSYFALGGGSWSAERLRHTAGHHVYAGRLLARVHQVPTLRAEVTRRRASHEFTHRSMSRHDERPANACPSAWWPSEAPLAPTPLRAAIPQRPNFVVFFVDTLRDDVARDPRVMPNVARFSRESLDFRQTYSTGSDTRSSLPAMTRGSYDLARQDEHDVLKIVKAHGIQTALSIATSPKRFLDKHVPQFEFDEVLEVGDADPDRKVWGYGAHRPTAASLVNDSLTWLSHPERKRFFLWQFHFDLHGWREMDERDLAQKAQAYGISRQGGEVWKYRTVAADIDAEFGRFLFELEARELARDTVVVFLSDHGEGLGRQGFWLHSVFLWESLVRVPLIFRVPGLEPQKINHFVSTMDLGPTLVRLMDPAASLVPYHGEDLLTQLGDERPARRFPILLRSVMKEEVVRIGLLDEARNRKLVIPLDSGHPELLDLTARSPDDVDVSLKEPDVVDALVPIALEGPMNPRAWRKHQRCMRSLVEPDPEPDALASESRRVSRIRPKSADADTTVDPT